MSEPLQREHGKSFFTGMIIFGIEASHRWIPINIKAGIPLERVLEPDFFKHEARKFRANDRLFFTSEDNAFDVDVRVVHADNFTVHLRPLRIWKKGVGDVRVTVDTDPPVDNSKKLPRVEWGGGHKWRVIGLDGSVVAKGFETEELAGHAMAEYAQTRRVA